MDLEFVKWKRCPYLFNLWHVDKGQLPMGYTCAMRAYEILGGIVLGYFGSVFLQAVKELIKLWI